MKWNVGNVEIFQIIELEAGKIIQSIIPDATPENVKKMKWLIPDYADKNGILKALIQSFLIKSQGKYILVDTCNGNDKNRHNIPEWG
ncbi:MAG: MBL fold metallo-hydrolase, partial [Patescibacteria group bacterium]